MAEFMQPRIVFGQPPVDAPHTQVAVVGAGACGLVAGIALRDAGVDCVLLERDAQPAGSTALSSGFIPAAGTPMQMAAGIEDSPAQFAKDISAKAHGRAAKHLVQAYCTEIPAIVSVLSSKHAIEFIVLDGFLYPGHNVRRMHAVPQKTGAALVAQLERAALASGADILTQATVREIWVDRADDAMDAGEGVDVGVGVGLGANQAANISAGAQRVTGVGYQRPDGRMEYLRCDALLLACNGFGGNAAMVRELLPEMQDALFAGHAGNDGSAIAWGKHLGARMADLGGYQGHGSWAVPQGALISWALMMEGGVQLNARGERFHDETQGYSEAAVHVLAQPGGVAWNVFDGAILELARSFPDFVEAEKAGAVKSCADAHALATLIGCDTTDVIATLNQMAVTSGLKPVKNGNLKRYSDKRVFKRPLTEPFYAVKVTGALFHTQGGLDIDAQCRVLDLRGMPFANLLAAGGAARGVSGDAVWGYLSGNGLLSAIAGGSIAARTASKMVAGLRS